MRANRYIFTLVLVISSLIIQAQSNNEISNEKRNQIDSLLQLMANHQLYNGGVLVALDNKVVYQKFLGYADFENKITHNSITQFNTASISKSLTAVAVFQLIQRKKMKLDDFVSRFLPDFPFDSVRIQDLLSHTSGLPILEDFEKEYIRKHPEEVISTRTAYTHLISRKDSMAIAPGIKWQYNNANYLILSLLIEKASGKSFAEYMRGNIFLPAGMKKSYVRETGMANTKRYMVPAMYLTLGANVDSLNSKVFDTYFNLGSINGAGNIVSTPEELIYFDNALNEGKLISKKYVDEMFTPYKLRNGSAVNLGGGRSYGFGWNVMNDPKKDRIVFHDGRIPGLRTILYKNLTKKLTLICYDNTDSRVFFLVVASIYKILYGDPLEPVWLKKSAARYYGEVLIKEGPDAAMVRLTELSSDSSHYFLDERDFNNLGYDLLYRGMAASHKKLALEVFKVNLLLYPGQANLYDSYAEGLLLNSYRKEALKMYQKAVELNPKNEAAKAWIKELLSD
jgi:CubicO group peptidase (beta-lactamase class C family)